MLFAVDASGSCHVEEGCDWVSGAVSWSRFSPVAVLDGGFPCECFSGAPRVWGALVDELSLVSAAARASEDVSAAPGPALGGFRDLVESFAACEEAASSLRSALSSGSVLTDLLTTSLEPLESAMVSLRAALSSKEARSVAEEAALFAASRAVPGGSSWVRLDASVALPGVGGANTSPVKQVRSAAFDAWVEARLSGASPAEASAAACDAALGLVPLLSVSQLPPSALFDVVAGEDLSAALKRMHRAFLVSVVSGLVESWEADAAAARALGPGSALVVLVDASRAQGDFFASLVLHAFGVAERPVSAAASRSFRVLLVPASVLALVEEGLGARSRSLVLFAEPAGPLDTPAALETALRLWVPLAPGREGDFASVLDAARTVCAPAVLV